MFISYRGYVIFKLLHCAHWTRNQLILTANIMIDSPEQLQKLLTIMTEHARVYSSNAQAFFQHVKLFTEHRNSCLPSNWGWDAPPGIRPLCACCSSRYPFTQTFIKETTFLSDEWLIQVSCTLFVCASYVIQSSTSSLERCACAWWSSEGLQPGNYPTRASAAGNLFTLNMNTLNI